MDTTSAAWGDIAHNGRRAAVMGWWNIKAKDVRVGDEIRVTVMGGTEFAEVLDVARSGDRIDLRLTWANVPLDPFSDRVPAEMDLTVRR